MRRLFDGRQKGYLYLKAEGRCERCGHPLGEVWHAHHRSRYADGGVTEVINGMALCERCHVLIHRKIGMVEPRGWQADALMQFAAHKELCFLLEATPGAGKTLFSAFCSRQIMHGNKNAFAVIVVPTTALKGGNNSGFLCDWARAGVEIKTTLKEKSGWPREFRGAVVTYQQLPNLLTTFAEWKRSGMQIISVLDEIHHATEVNVWGSAVEELGRLSVKIIGMTGTAFRDDGRRISFVKYGEDGKVKADFAYGYRQAVGEKVCRPVSFMTDDGIAEFVLDEESREVRLSEAETGSDLLSAAKTIFQANSQWLETFIQRADAKLEEYRAWDHKAGGLVVCRPGRDSNDDRHLAAVARVVRKVTGDEPEVICHDDLDANAKIERFAAGSKKWVCAVRKITEGVDIKRLRVCVIANRPTTELLFRQIVGRVVRVTDRKQPGDATVYIAKFPQLVGWSKTIQEEAECGLKDRDQDEPGERTLSEGPEQPSAFTPIGATHEEGGAISDFGDEYTADEINAAEKEKTADPQLFDVPVTKLAYLRRKFGVAAEPMQTAQKPLYVKKKELREQINTKARRLAIKLDPLAPDFKTVWIRLHKVTGARNIDDLMDNYTIDVMRKVSDLLGEWLVNKDAAA